MRVWIVIAFALLAACRSPAPIPQPPAEDTHSGRVSGELIVDPAAPASEPEPSEVYEPPTQRSGNVMPAYPADWVQAGLPARTVTVRIVVGRDGQVSKVLPQGDETADAAELAMRAAVERAVLAWRFEPFRVVQWTDGPDRDGDGLPDSQVAGPAVARPFRFDMRFRFEIVDGKPQVR